jgi:hypothetical protein
LTYKRRCEDAKRRSLDSALFGKGFVIKRERFRALTEPTKDKRNGHNHEPALKVRGAAVGEPSL